MVGTWLLTFVFSGLTLRSFGSKETHHNGECPLCSKSSLQSSWSSLFLSYVLSALYPNGPTPNIPGSQLPESPRWLVKAKRKGEVAVISAGQKTPR
ncbi:hypothetical protein K435DRAFT_156948 [Dendrothele bispora CBS 962.96]|uniref:Secreted protein n=1 Tax=Dendrothele bispora (strain CBS 962.96) TaxID=1314807 RepID=A0A4S8LZ13_DENBC|nr:hypothetical protein K435DRAFT_156948 [Dendrothele bispora CBS 962.96]